jgi:hypothetical protein
MSRDDGVDEHGIDWLCEYHQVGFFGLEVGQIKADFCQTPTTNLTRSMTHMGYMTTQKLLIEIIWTFQEMMEWMSMELIAGSKISSGKIFWLGVGQIKADILHTPTTNLTQHDTHGQYDHPKTIDYNII